MHNLLHGPNTKKNREWEYVKGNIKQTIAQQISNIDEKKKSFYKKDCKRIRVEKKNREVSNNQRF